MLVNSLLKGLKATFKIAQQERPGHIDLEVLDYSQLLRGEGEEIKDIWPYLLIRQPKTPGIA